MDFRVGELRKQFARKMRQTAGPILPKLTFPGLDFR